MSWKETLEFLESVPGRILSVAVVGIVALVAIQMWRGDALICADGSFFAKSCGPATSIDLTAGAVVAFDRERGCPDGWEVDTGAAGRFIVGAGNATESNDDGTRVDPIKFGTKGGLNKVKLEIPHLPKHSHENPTRGSDTEGIVGALHAVDDGRDDKEHKHRRPTLPTGEGQAHDNMPPYVALFYCKKK